MFFSITILDANDNDPEIHAPNGCITITEFQDVNSQITLIHSSDPDDPNTPNGQIMMDIISGNELGMLFYYLHLC